MCLADFGFPLHARRVVSTITDVLSRVLPASSACPCAGEESGGPSSAAVAGHEVQQGGGAAGPQVGRHPQEAAGVGAEAAGARGGAALCNNTRQVSGLVHPIVQTNFDETVLDWSASKSKFVFLSDSCSSKVELFAGRLSRGIVKA